MSLPGRCLSVSTPVAEALLEAQRRAIGREIHDAIGGALAAVHFDLSWLAGQAPRDAEAQARLTSAQAALRAAMDATRHAVVQLYPPDLSGGLAPAVARLVADFGRRTGIAADFDALDAETTDLDAPRQLAVYRTAQEALTNIARHAQCARVRLTLRDEGGADHGDLVLEVRDDGCGFSLDAAVARPDAFGLRGMAERARAVDGRLDVASAPGRGTSVTLTLPRSSVRREAE
ncbi:MAG: sensor histidine kinase [Janthinobacterium lividum]